MNIQMYLKDMGKKILLLKESEEVDNNFIIKNTNVSLTELQFIFQGTNYDITFNELKQIISLITGYEDELDELYSLIENTPFKQLLEAYEQYNEFNSKAYKPLDARRSGKKSSIKSKKEKPLTPAQIKKEKIKTVNDESLCKRCYVCENPLFIKFDAYKEKIIDDEIVYIYDVCVKELKSKLEFK